MHNGDWLKQIDPNKFTHQRHALFYLGHAISDEYPDFSNETYRRFCSDVPYPRGERWENAVASYQQYNCRHLPLPAIRQVDGDFGPYTQSTIATRCCGNPDIMPSVLEAGHLAKWGKLSLTVYTDMRISGLDQSRMKELFLQAWKSWTDVCGLKPVEWGSRFDIYSESKRIDGPGRALAYAYLPNGSNYTGPALQIVFDSAEQFSRESFFLSTAVHEGGHIFGLGHSQNRADIMYPQLNGETSPGPWSTRQMVQRYGEADENETPPPGDSIKPGDKVTVSGVIQRVLGG